MATVTGITAEKAQEIEDASVVSGAIDEGTGHLILTKAGGEAIDAGVARPEIFPTAVTRYLTAQTDTVYTVPPDAVALKIRAHGSSGGGGSGCRSVDNAYIQGGGGGAAGGESEFDVRTEDLVGAVVKVSLGAAGVGGAAVTVNDTVGNPGTSGGDALVTVTLGGGDPQTLVLAKGGAGGLGGIAGFDEAETGASASGGLGLFNGGNGAGATDENGQAPPLTISSRTYGGGSGAGIHGDNSPRLGGSGGPIRGISATGAVGGSIPGAGGDGAEAPAGILTGGGSGGGGASSYSSAAGAGGNGARGAGGGGGGASHNGHNSGKGGNGALGFVEIIAYF